MCFYDRTEWTCHYWQWSDLRERCLRARSNGRVCEVKLVLEVRRDCDDCPLCKATTRDRDQIADIDTRMAELELRRPHELEESMREMMTLDRALRSLTQSHNERQCSAQRAKDSRHNNNRRRCSVCDEANRKRFQGINLDQHITVLANDADDECDTAWTESNIRREVERKIRMEDDIHQRQHLHHQKTRTGVV